MSEGVKSKCNWWCSLCCLIGVIALVLVLMHRADEGVHSAKSMGEDADQEPGSKKFDHVELLNVGPVEIPEVRILLADAMGNPVIAEFPAGPLKVGELLVVPVLQNIEVKQVILKYEYTVGPDAWLRTRTLAAYEPPSGGDCIRSARFWAQYKMGPTEIPEFWGQALIVNLADQHHNTVLPAQDPGADVKLP